MNKRTALGVAISLALAYPGVLNALGLGEIHSNSQLNQPLRAQIDLLSTNAREASQLRVKLAAPEVFNRVGIDRPPILENLRFKPTMKSGKPVIIVSSDQPLNEPFLNFLLEVTWPQGQLLKEYTVLLDPPVLLDAGTTTADNAAAVRAEPRPTGVVNRTQPQPRQPAPSTATRVQSNNQQQAAQQRQQSAADRLVAEQAAIAAREEAEAKQKQSTQRQAAPAQSQSSRKYRVRRGDTMSKVASKMRYPGVSNDQMMIALFRANPHAFIKDNINYLRAGSVLERPAKSEVSDLARADSRRLVKQHFEQWRKYRSGVASTPKPQQEMAPKETAAKPSPAPTMDNDKADAQANLKVVGSKDATETGSATGDAELAEKLALAQEALASSKSENAELQSRVSRLEAIVRKKDRLITLKNERLAKLEEQLGSSQPASTLDNQSSEAETGQTGAATSTTEDLVQQVAQAEDAQEGRIIRGTEEGEATTPPAEEEQPGQAAEAQTLASSQDDAGAEAGGTDEGELQRLDSPFAEEKSQEGSILDLLKSPLVAAVGGGSLLALLLGLLFMRRKSAENEADILGDDEFETADNDKIFVDEDMEVIDDKAGDELNAGFEDFEDDIDSNFETAADVDEFTTKSSSDSDVADELDAILSEESMADDEVLQEADVYIVYGLHEQAEEELKRAIAETPDKLEYRVKLLENYEASGNEDGFVEQAQAFLAVDGDSKQKQALWDKIVSMSKKVAPDHEMFAEKDVSGAAKGFAAAGIAAAAVGAVKGLMDDDKNDDLDVSDLNDDFDGFGLDDLGLDDEPAENVSDDLGDIVDSVESESLDELDTRIEGLDDFDLPEDEDIGLDELNKSIETSSDNVLNFDIPSSDKNDDDAIKGVNLDIDSDSGMDKILPTDSGYSSSDDESDELDDALSFLDLSDDDQEMQEAHIGTKLDLARAYLDMGDVEGARCTLEEVVVEGNEEQKREAEELLQQTG